LPALHQIVGIFGIAAVLVTAGCSEPSEPPSQPPLAVASGLYPPWTLNQSPERIVLRWYPDVTLAAAARQAAQDHCGLWNRSAQLVSDTRDGSAEIAEFRCR
jgi:hypothetical protein